MKTIHEYCNMGKRLNSAMLKQDVGRFLNAN